MTNMIRVPDVTRHSRSISGRQAGVSLIEVLVAILIFSFGLVGLAGLQARALQYSTSAEDTSRAALLANEMASAMLNQNTVNVVTLGGAISTWQARVADPTTGGLPGGVGTVTADPLLSNAATILVTWQPPSAAGAAFNSQNQYFTSVILP